MLVIGQLITTVRRKGEGLRIVAPVRRGVVASTRRR
jgi:hypothetical protein